MFAFLISHVSVKKMVTINCNGQQHAVADDSSVTDFINILGFDTGTVVVELDGNILKPDEYASTKLSDGCELELIRFVGGG